MTTEDGMHSARARVVADVNAALAQATERVVTAITRQIPAYAALRAEQLGEVTAIAEWGITRVLQLWVEDSRLSAADEERFKAIGAARALDGRPLSGVLRAYRLAGVEMLSLIEHVGGTRLTVTDALALSRLWLASVDSLSEALSAGHGAASDRIAGDRERAVADLLADLVAGRHSTRTALAERLRGLAVDLPATVRLLLVTNPAAELEPSELVGLPPHFAVGDQSLVGTIDGWGLVALPPTTPSSTQLADWVRQRGWRGCLIGPIAPVDLPRGRRLAGHGLERAPRRAYAGGRLLDEADAQALALVGKHPDADPDRLAQLLIDPLRQRSGRTLVEGLHAYLETDNAVAAAGILGLHPQSMRHRLSQIASITGRDPRRAWDRFVFEVAVLAQAPSTDWVDRSGQV